MFYYLDRPADVLRPNRSDWRGGSLVLIARESKLDALQSMLKLDRSSGRIIEGFNYVRGRRVRVWIGHAQATDEDLHGL